MAYTNDKTKKKVTEKEKAKKRAIMASKKKHGVLPAGPGKVKISASGEKAYQKALAEWNKKKKEGLTAPGPKPTRAKYTK